jgi:hypothetical protein
MMMLLVWVERIEFSTHEQFKGRATGILVL